MTDEINLNPKYENLFKDQTRIRYIIISGGRGSGKSFATSLYLANKFIKSKKNCMYLRQYMVNADQSTIPQFLSQVSILNINSYFKIKHGVIENTFGSKLYFKGFKTSDNNADSQLKSIPHLETILIEEATEVKEEAFDKLNLSVRDSDAHPKIILALNPSSQDHWIYRRFFKDAKVPYNYNGRKGNTLYIHTTYLDNIDHLDSSFITEAEAVKDSNPIKYNNLFLGKWLSDNDNALWSTKMINDCHVDAYPPEKYDKVVIGVDPAVTSNKTSDETGIIVAARRHDMYYILGEFTGKYTPKRWGDIVVDLYHRMSANYVVVEVNQGGDLCIDNIHSIDPTVLIKAVHASKGKILRAEPIASLYEQNKVKHLRCFSQLEEEMQTYTGNAKDKSPNSLDALVWAMTYLTKKRNDNSGF